MDIFKYFKRKNKRFDFKQEKSELVPTQSQSSQTERKSKLDNEKNISADVVSGKDHEIELNVEEKKLEAFDKNDKADILGPYDPMLDLSEYKYPDQIKLTGLMLQDFTDMLRENYEGMSLPIIWSTYSTSKDHMIKDVAELKNILIVGSQATGKTTFIHQIINSLLIARHPSVLKFVLIDPKKVELSIYKTIEKHFLAKLPGEEDAIISDTKKLIHTLNALCILMDIRYDLMKAAGTRNIKEYNQKFAERKLNPEKGHEYLPSIILIIDDLGAYSYQKIREIDLSIQRLLSDGYKVGIFTVICASQFSGDTLSNGILSLIHQRVIFRLNNKDDYRRFLDTVKVDRFVKEGEFLYNDENMIKKGLTLPLPFSEIERIVESISVQKSYPEAFMLPEYMDEKEFENKTFDVNDRDSLFEDAARLIVVNQSGSTSLLQRKMKLGYDRAGRLMDQLEAAGIVGPSQGSKVRDVLIKTDADLQEYLSGM